MQHLSRIGLLPLWLATTPPAGLTNDTNEVVADPERIEEAISLPDPEGLVSLAAPGWAGGGADHTGASAGGAPPPPPLLRHCGGVAQLGGRCGGGAAAPLDATFRLAAPLAGCDAAEPATGLPSTGCSPAATRRLLMQPAGAAALGSPPSLQLASFEPASQPGFFLTADAASGRLRLAQAREAAPASQTFLLHLQPAGRGATAAQLAFTLEPLSQPGRRVVLGGDGAALHVGPASRGAATAAAPAFVLAPPAVPGYPPGARRLHGANRDYLLVPLGQVWVGEGPCSSQLQQAGRAASTGSSARPPHPPWLVTCLADCSFCNCRSRTRPTPPTSASFRRRAPAQQQPAPAQQTLQQTAAPPPAWQPAELQPACTAERPAGARKALPAPAAGTKTCMQFATRPFVAWPACTAQASAPTHVQRLNPPLLAAELLAY